MNTKLLVDSGSFWNSLEADIASAQDAVLIQTLSFEGDAAGIGLSKAMRTCAAEDRRIIVDSFTKHFISDRSVHTRASKRDPAHRSEVEATKKMMEDNRNAGVAIRFVSPFGFLFRKLPNRNHKKMMVIDGRISYIGGCNFSDHNFRWHDMMLRMDDPDVAAFLEQDFERTWRGNNQVSEAHFDGLSLHLVDGRHNEAVFEKQVLNLINEAVESIFIESPYLSFPFYGALRRAVERGVEVTLVMPDQNNRQLVQRYTEWETQRSGISLYRYLPEMTHLKAMLVDEKTLVMGSSNFDYLSYRSHPEVIARVTDSEVIGQFIRQVRDPDLANSSKPTAGSTSTSTALLYAAMKLAGRVSVAVARL